MHTVPSVEFCQRIRIETDTPVLLVIIIYNYYHQLYRWLAGDISTSTRSRWAIYYIISTCCKRYFQLYVSIQLDTITMPISLTVRVRPNY